MDNENLMSEAMPMRPADVATTYRQLQEVESWEDEADLAPDDMADEEDESEGGFVRYNRAFIAKMSLAADNLKAYYNVLKNTLLSYKGVKSRLSWCCDSFNCGRNQLAKINVRGNGLIVYFALDADDYEGTKYRYRDVGFKKKFAQVPMQIKVKSKRGLRYAIELTADVMRRFDIKAGKPHTEAYAPERESVESLMRRNLVRVVNQATSAPSTGSGQDALPEVGVLETVAADVAPVLVDAAVAESHMTDSEARAQIVVEQGRRRRGNKKCMLNLDVIGRAFGSGDEVTIDNLIAKKMVHPQCGYLKICARGALDKPLTVKANDFSLIAVKMIVLTGGKAVRVKGE